jgi:catechol 2,3-dioxygenase-like lactoylglutathione lyase family enzyme
MHVQALGHVVLKVRDLEQSEIFYSDILGMRVVSRISDPPMTFFRTATSVHHHDFALMELSPHAPITSSSDQNVIGLAHVAFKIGRSAEELRHARSVLDVRDSASMRPTGPLPRACTSSIQTETRSSYTSRPSDARMADQNTLVHRIQAGMMVHSTEGASPARNRSPMGFRRTQPGARTQTRIGSGSRIRALPDSHRSILTINRGSRAGH